MAGGEHQGRPISLFYSYSHKDEELRRKLEDHLFPLQRAGLIEVWHDREMLPGDTVDKEIAEKLRSADLILVLVSPSFIKSSYCYDIELANAIKRHERGDARVVPVILRPCQWRLTPLKALSAMPTDGRAVTTWPNRDTAFNDVAEGIAKLVKAMRQRGSKAADPAAAGAKPAAAGTGAASAPPPPHPGPLPQSGEGDLPDAAGTPHPPADAGPSFSRRERAGVRVDPRELPDFAVFRDVDVAWCPEMVVLPAGEFLMGSPEDEQGRLENEGPQHRVQIGYRFAIGRYAVTFAEYDNYVMETNENFAEWMLKVRDDGGWGRGRRPTINVDWWDAKYYVEWLSEKTRRNFRLPSEAEWEYACRAGTTTPYSFGDTATPIQVNYREHSPVPGRVLKGTVEVGSLPANSWGLHEMHGNVWEWVEDVFHISYAWAPVNGSPWTDGEKLESNRNRVVRGGSWDDHPRACRCACRFGYKPERAYLTLGFRVVRDV